MEQPGSELVLVKNISPHSSDDSLLLYLENVTGEDVKKVFYGQCRTIAVALFEDKIKEFSKAVVKAKNKALEGHILELSLMSCCDKIIIKDLPKDGVSADYLELYFESKAAGGWEVKKCTFENEKKRAVVEFEDPSAVPAILSREHEKLGTSVQLMPYVEEFMKDDEVTDPGSSQVTKGTTPTRIPPPLPPKPPGEVLRKIVQQKGVRVLPLHQTSQDDNMVPFPSGRPPTPSGDSSKDHSWQSTSMYDLTSIPPKGSLQNPAPFMQFSPKPPANQIADKDIKEDKTSGMEVSSGQNEPPNQQSQGQQQPKEKETQKTIKSTKSKVELLSKLGFWADTVSPSLKTGFKEDGIIEYQGTESAVRDVVLKTYEKLQEVSEKMAPVSLPLHDLLQKKEAADRINKAFENKAIDVVWKVGGSVIAITALGEKNAEEAVSVLLALLHKEQYDVDPDSQGMLATATFLKVIEDLQCRHLVVITVDRAIIVFEGFLKEVKESLKAVQDYFEVNAIVTAALTAGKRELKYLSIPQIKNKIRETLEMLNSKNPVLRVSFDIKPEEGELVLRGTRDLVRQAKETIDKDFIRTITSAKVDVNKIGMTEFLQETTGSSLLKTIGSDNQCYVELEVKATQRPDSAVSEPTRIKKKPQPPQAKPRQKATGQQKDIMSISAKFLRALLHQRRVEVPAEAEAEKDEVPETKQVKTPQVKKAPLHLMEGGIKITLVQADITKDRWSSVLVNVVTEKLTLQYGLAKIFLNAAGEELEKALSSQAPGNFGEVKVTARSGKLPESCKEVYHMVCQQYKPGHEKTLRAMVEECLKMAAKSKHPSISFPSVGCGGLHFPPPLVAKTMFDVIMKFAGGEGAKSSVKYINLIVWEPRTYGAFLEELKSRQGGAAASKVEDDDDDEGEMESESDSGSDDAGPPPQATALAASSGTRASPVTSTIFIYGTKKGVAIVTRRIQDLLKKHYKEEQITEDVIRSLTKKDLAPLQDKAKALGVGISIDQKTTVVLIKGEASKVHSFRADAMSFFSSKIKECSSGSWKLQQALQHGSRADHIAALAESTIICAPQYWSKKYKGSGSVISPKKGPENYQLLPVDDKMRQAITEMLQKTWQAHLVGHGRDAKGLAGYQNIKVTKVERVENPQQYLKYGFIKKEHCQKYQDGTLRPFYTVDSNLAKVLTSTLGIGHLDRHRLEEINEYYLFHGTKKENIRSICSTGVDFRIANEGGMFGQGIYTAESSSKADQYADATGDRQTTGLKMFVCRVLLGDVFYCRETKKFPRPPCTGAGCNDPKCRTHENFHDSVIGDAQKLFREFVVYDRGQCYPEFLVTYDRV
ncbi:uncharacterized protein LOC106164469 [Lingula anatina]|uniref:Poly [ADP-ribose] polymerase n=1 Tax=Lingula anatina TaxID=7574 RepID=A0A1S3II15_LINAN|nr:uncharacterized protein LOC106164469 [Lingula anatina]|eukprot:XP_013397857.1 uncharacterized protein LOC106164469 [Lingula anatina]